MNFKDKLRLLFAKIFIKETILFSKKDDWERPIRKKIRSYVPFFYELSETNPNYFDAVVPLTLYAQKYMNAHPELFATCKYVIPSDFCINLCDDKEAFTVFLVKNGFGRFAPKINGNFSYPYILKKKTGAWGDGVFIINDLQCELAHIDEIESDDYFTQEYIEGQDEYTAHVIFQKGKIVFIKALKFTFSCRYFVKGMNFSHVSAEEVDHGNFKPIFESILVKMAYQGICCFNYKVINKNLIKIFEINPRYGGSLTHFLNDALISYRNATDNA